MINARNTAGPMTIGAAVFLFLKMRIMFMKSNAAYTYESFPNVSARLLRRTDFEPYMNTLPPIFMDSPLLQSGKNHINVI